MTSILCIPQLLGCVQYHSPLRKKKKTSQIMVVTVIHQRFSHYNLPGSAAKNLRTNLMDKKEIDKWAGRRWNEREFKLGYIKINESVYWLTKNNSVRYLPRSLPEVNVHAVSYVCVKFVYRSHYCVPRENRFNIRSEKQIADRTQHLSVIVSCHAELSVTQLEYSVALFSAQQQAIGTF